MSETIWDIGTNLFDGGVLYFLIRSGLILILSFAIGKVVWKSFGKMADKDEQKRMTLHFLGRIVRAMIYVIGVSLILGGIKPLAGLNSAILGATSVISVIIGLAAQESFGNFIAGFFLALYHPFNVGDIVYIKDKDISGTVTGITFRHTELVTIENSKVIVPNSIMNSAIVENRGYGQDRYTRYLTFDIGYDSDVSLATKLIYEACLSTENVIDVRKNKEDVPFDVRVEAFDESGIQITFPLYVTSFAAYFNAASEVRKKLLKSFKENEIEIPYNKIEIVSK